MYVCLFGHVDCTPNVIANNNTISSDTGTVLSWVWDSVVGDPVQEIQLAVWSLKCKCCCFCIINFWWLIKIFLTAVIASSFYRSSSSGEQRLLIKFQNRMTGFSLGTSSVGCLSSMCPRDLNPVRYSSINSPACTTWSADFISAPSNSTLRFQFTCIGVCRKEHFVDLAIWMFKFIHVIHHLFAVYGPVLRQWTSVRTGLLTVGKLWLGHPQGPPIASSRTFLLPLASHKASTLIPALPGPQVLSKVDEENETMSETAHPSKRVQCGWLK